MKGNLYRFRPIDTLLGRHEELQRQEIYFASPAELNDPMEGFGDVIWQGDAIVWENLLRHYLVCLERAFSLVIIGGQEQEVSWAHLPVVDPGDERAFSPKHRELHDRIFERFFSEPGVQKLVQTLTLRRGPVRRNELTMYLGCAHQMALLCIREAYVRAKLIPTLEQEEEPARFARAQLENASTLIDQLEVVKRTGPIDEDAIDAMFGFSRLMNEQMALIHFHNGQASLDKRGMNFIAYGFSEGYISQIERNLYPDWFAACFMEGCSNSSVWGSYGQSHTGVCLRFRTTVHEGRHRLVLNRIHGANSDGPLRGDAEVYFHKVQYSREHPSIDFFASLGRLPQPVLAKYWFTNALRERSASAVAMHSDEAKWREAYWKAFSQLSTQKLIDWEYEKEHRLVQYSSLVDLAPPENRKATYRFEDLEGIIFGIRTTMESKLAIFKIVEEKCRATNRTDFKFYQSYYGRQKGQVEHHELGLLKFE